MNDKVVVEIVKQPPLVERFRYKSEDRTAAQGAFALDRKTYPAIRVLNYTGAATVLVSCVTSGKPYRQHPNSIVGDNCCKGVCRIEFDTNKSKPTVVTFANIAIQCIKKDEVKKVLEEREKLNIDPFKAGFQHKCVSIFEAAVRLCFQVLLRPSAVGPNGRVKYVPIPPVVSEIIHSKMDLTIFDISDTTSPATGQKTIMVFCSKILRGDIKIRFYRDNENRTVEWEAWGESIKVHRQAAIAFKTPAYAKNDIQEPVDVRVQLFRPSDGKRSEPPVYFQYLPDLSNIDNSIRKKHRGITETEALFQYVQQMKEEKRKGAKMELNIQSNPAGPSNQHFNEGAAARPEALQSNFNPNFSRHGQPHENPTVQSYRHQQAYFDSRNLQHSHIQHGVQSGICPQPYGERSQINFSQPQPQVRPPTIHPLSNFPRDQFQMQTEGSKVLNPVYSQFQPQNIYSEFQSSNNLQLQQRNSNALKPLQDLSQQLQLQQHSCQPILNHTSSNVGCNAKGLVTPYNPFQSYYNSSEQVYDPTSSNVHQFATGNIASMVRNGQNLCETNLNAEDIIKQG